MKNKKANIGGANCINKRPTDLGQRILKRAMIGCSMNKNLFDWKNPTFASRKKSDDIFIDNIDVSARFWVV